MNTYSKHFKTYDDLKYQINNACAFRKDLTKLNIFNIFQYIKLLSSKVFAKIFNINRILDFYVPAGVITSH